MRGALAVAAAIALASCKSPPASSQVAAGWHAGDRRDYDVELDVRARIEAAPVTQFALRGRWVVTAVDVTAERALLVAELAGTLRTEYTSLQAEYTALERELAAPFVFAIQSDGTLGDAYLDARTPAIVVGIWRTLGASLQFARTSSDEWTAEEVDATGRYVAHYRLSSPGTYEKQKLRYVALATAGPKARMPSVAITSEIAEATTTLGVGRDGRVERVRAHEVARARTEVMPIEWESTLSLARVADRVAPRAGWKQLVAQRERYAADRAFVGDADAHARDAALIGDKNLDDVLAEADVSITGDERAKANAFAQVRAVLRIRPGAIDQARALIEAGANHAPLLIDALGSAGTADAQRLLRQLLTRADLDPNARKLVAIGLSRTPEPRAESMQALVSLLDDPRLRVQATYGVGTMARRFVDAGRTAEANAAITILRDRAAAANSALDLVVVLRGIANSGSAALYPVAERHFEDADDGVRAAAVEALQLMDAPRVDAAIADRLARDPSDHVRLAAGRAARLRDPSPVLRDAVAARVRIEPDDHVRLGLVRVLAAWAPKHNQVKSVLEWVAAHDAQDALRREAGQALRR